MVSFYLFLLQVAVGTIVFAFCAVVLAIAASMIASVIRQSKQPKQPKD